MPISDQAGAEGEQLTLDQVERAHARADGGGHPTTTPQAEAFARQMKAQGYRFVGPTSAYAFMQNTGLVNDHVRGCFRAVS